MPNLLSTAQGGTIDARMDFTLDNTDDLTLFAINGHVQFISPTGLGGYAAVPFVYASANGESESAVGNVELGGLYAMRQGIYTDVLLRGGIALDTAAEEDILILAAGQLSPKILDIYTSGFATTWARAQAQLRHASGNLRLGGEIGFDLPVDGLAKDADVDGMLTGALSLGVAQPGVGFGIGFAMVKVLGSSADDDTFTSINATVDFPVGGTTRFFGAFGYPEPDENEFDVFAVGGGIRAGF